MFPLSGYQDIRRKSTEGSIFVENTKVNKSIYTLFNVVYALNANESHVPYRESKLTRMLQESLGCKSKILMLTCLVCYLASGPFFLLNLFEMKFLGIKFGQLSFFSVCRAHLSAKIPCI